MDNQDTKNLKEIIPSIIQLQDDKSKLYGRSWCKYGEVSAFFNLARKYDRLENIMKKALNEGTAILHSKESSTANETFLDTVVDTAVYSLLWVGYIKENYPEEWKIFLKNNNLILEEKTHLS